MIRLRSILAFICVFLFAPQTHAIRFSLTVQGPGHIDNFSLVLEGIDEFGGEDEVVTLFDSETIGETTVVRDVYLDPEKIWALSYANGEIRLDDAPCTVSVDCGNCNFTAERAIDFIGGVSDYYALSGNLFVTSTDMEFSLVVDVQKRDDLLPVSLDWSPAQNIHWQLNLEGALYTANGGFAEEMPNMTGELDADFGYQVWNGEDTQPTLYVLQGGDLSVSATYQLGDESVYKWLDHTMVIDVNGTEYDGGDVCLLSAISSPLDIIFRIKTDDSDRYLSYAAQGGGGIAVAYVSQLGSDTLLTDTLCVRDSTLLFDRYALLTTPGMGINNITSVTLIPDDTCKVIGLAVDGSDRLKDYLGGNFDGSAYRDVSVVFGPDTIPYVIADDVSRVYGAGDVTYTYTVRGGNIDGEPLLASEATAASPVGTYPITVSAGSIQCGFVGIPGTLTVTKAPLVVTANDIVMYVDEELPQPTLTYDGFVNGDDESVLLQLPQVNVPDGIDFSVAGTYPLTVSGGQAANYDLSYQAGNLIVVVPVPIVFADDAARDVCLANWDLNGDSILIEWEAEQVTDLGKAFAGNDRVASFDELRYFTSLTQIPDSAFIDCTSLQSVTLPQGITSVGRESFAGCTSLRSFDITKRLGSIGIMAFARCDSLQGFSVQDGNTAFSSVGGVLFNNNQTTLIAYPNGKGTRYQVPSGTTTIGAYAFAYSTVDSIGLPTSLRTIGDHAFVNSWALDTLVVAQGVTAISSYAFAYSPMLRMVTIPSTVKTLGSYIFYGCDAVAHVYSNISEPFDMDTDNFSATAYRDAVLHVGSDNKVRYMFARGWSKFGHISGESLEVAVNDAEMMSGGTSVVTLSLLNHDMEVTIYQFELTLPDGLTLQTDADGQVLFTPSARHGSHAAGVTVTETGSGRYHVEWSPGCDACLDGKDGILLTFTLQADAQMTRGTYTAQVSGFSAPRLNGTSLSAANASFTVNVLHFGLGDVNHDDVVNIADVMLIVGNILGNTSSKFNADCADVNADGLVDVADVMGTVNIILSAPQSTPMLSVQADDRLTLRPGSDRLTLSLTRPSDYTACQMTICVPAGGILTDAKLSDGVSAGHSVRVSDLGDGRYCIVVFGAGGNTFAGSARGLMDLSVIGADASQVTVADIQLTNQDCETVVLAGSTTAIGSINTDTPDAGSYTLQGIKATAKGRGVYVKKGGKYVSK